MAKKIAIVAVDNNWAIGKDNELLYHIHSDMKFFKKITTGNTVVYGRKTLESFPNGEPLPNRFNIVLSSKTIEKANVTTAHNLKEIDEILKESERFEQDVYICGGTSIYNQMIDNCDEALVTKINATADEADSYFPNLDKKPNWKVVGTSGKVKDEKTGIFIEFLIYKNIGKTR